MTYSHFVKMHLRFRFYPTIKQAAMLAKVFGACRWTYNTMLRIRTDSYAKGVTINYVRSAKMFTEMRHAPETNWLEGISSVPPQQALRHLQNAFQRFFDKKNGYPKFKTKNSRQSAEYTASGFTFRNGVLSVAQLGPIDVRWSRKFSSSPTTVTITKHPSGRYYATLVLDEVVEHLPKTDAAVGIDLGINRLATLSNGERIPNPRHLRKQFVKLARLQKRYARRKNGSGRKQRTQQAIAVVYEKIANSRRDYLHKATTEIVRNFDFVAVEDLNVKGMLHNRCVSLALSDVGMAGFVKMLGYKCEWYGKTFVMVDRFFPSSKRCSSCGYIAESMPLREREWVCPECGVTHDRDENAAHNILAAGHAVAAQGERVRPVRALARKGISRRTVNQVEQGTA
jgi:putative transposase